MLTSVAHQKSRKDYVEAADKLIRQAADATGSNSYISEMVRYQMDTGGKRFRPRLVFRVAKALGLDPERLVPLAAAIELVHQASLVHDDIQDGDTTRRGMPTAWCQFGTARAINLGDAMLYQAPLMVLELDAPADRVQYAQRLLLQSVLGMIEGQEREMAMTRSALVSLEDYDAVAEGKTGALMRLCMESAAVVCGVDMIDCAALGEAGSHLGVAFQIMDDIIDIYGEKGREESCRDIAEGKRSALVVHALAEATPSQALELLTILDTPREETTQEQIMRAKELFEETGAVEAALNELRRRCTLATDFDGEIKLVQMLLAMTDKVLALIPESLWTAAPLVSSVRQIRTEHIQETSALPRPAEHSPRSVRCPSLLPSSTTELPPPSADWYATEEPAQSSIGLVTPMAKASEIAVA